MSVEWAGIGARDTPRHILKEMHDISHAFALKGYVLRSGGAAGADHAFEEGYIKATHILPKIEKANHVLHDKKKYNWAYDKLRTIVPPYVKSFDDLSEWTRALLARNVVIILGEDGKHPVNFVLCWTITGADNGGTGWGIRCADSCGIPVVNMKIDGWRTRLNHIVRSLPSTNPQS